MKDAARSLQAVNDAALSDRMQQALNEVEQMGIRGLTAVPVKPTQEMLTAGAQAGSISIEAAMAVYTAMLRAAD
ncbi:MULTISPECIES: hypothetical protein [unclassified Azospirillum]|uniref:hypothetical protein n=1 Tax=unclassified Azospirillum TaxID=2630922 RepID=UPI000B67EF88|nr:MULTISPECIES: hypothetical protein [unclassified Azospirillum]SNS56595.1 hypothetical protein SAMN05880556_10792 [Azospirillum sp. RU38E]SNS76149.1 hypothetical protein SAMN05880591_10792 [Azospirillum sp. RU37A]